ncbi:MAG: twin-arginine translocase subunit TatC [Candidatus Heimdallarchaeota archaeon]
MSSDEEVKLTFWGHLVELFRRLRIIFFAIAICTIVVMVVPISFESSGMWYPTITSTVIKQMQIDFLPSGAELLPFHWIAPLEVYLFISIILGVMISSPVIAYELYKFINPALRKREKKAVLKFVVPFVGLYFVGSTFGYLLIAPIMMRTLMGFAGLLGLPPIYEFADFYSLIGMTLFISGLIFTFPVFLIALVKAGFITTGFIRRNRRYVYGGIIILIAIIDPEPGLVTEAVLFIPILILMESSLLIARRIERRMAEEYQRGSKNS